MDAGLETVLWSAGEVFARGVMTLAASAAGAEAQKSAPPGIFCGIAK
jgi:hypothetical protein